MAELNRLGAAPAGPLRRLAVDTHLGRWPQALDALGEAGRGHFDAALALARERGLLRQLLGAYPQV